MRFTADIRLPALQMSTFRPVIPASSYKLSRQQQFKKLPLYRGSELRLINQPSFVVFRKREKAHQPSAQSLMVIYGPQTLSRVLGCKVLYPDYQHVSQFETKYCANTTGYEISFQRHFKSCFYLPVTIKYQYKSTSVLSQMPRSDWLRYPLSI